MLGPAAISFLFIAGVLLSYLLFTNIDQFVFCKGTLRSAALLGLGTLALAGA